ncbi:hypothetical protein [Mycobacterium riyadhense]|uniref:Uncharacterized protein n=1 Tax=Mycobacterium riyadhense TaxID=486698 RepID=A0A1X2D134_9MYCO|nr:hypothetical protein [Mycobacterium riyadhense]MCV7146821.1 hypothetical protein [Mycobacterium riyadhense]ORW81902.1 hypothetical protein AWC22_16525 [Mycobacterium riyadhense]VTO95324.1 hypothetical protein BIN_B_00802 [Mycobacterium riyadhense]
MSRLSKCFAAHYGSNPLHLLTMVSGFALLGYILATFKPATLWNPNTWWQSIAVWLAAAIIGHDLVLFPIYALADRLVSGKDRRRHHLYVVARNHIRIPAMGAALTLLIFLPGIIQQGAATYQAATGETQQPFLGRWLLLTAAMFAISALGYAARLAIARFSVEKGAPDQGK